jgi:hypothetical protein
MAIVSMPSNSSLTSLDDDHDKYMGVRVPFWIVRVPADTIDNHGGILSDDNMALMAAIFRMHRPILPNNVTAPAKPYTLPLPPGLKGPSH